MLSKLLQEEKEKKQFILITFLRSLNQKRTLPAITDLLLNSKIFCLLYLLQNLSGDTLHMYNSTKTLFYISKEYKTTSFFYITKSHVLGLEMLISRYGFYICFIQQREAPGTRISFHETRMQNRLSS